MRTWASRSEAIALHHSVNLFSDIPRAIPVDECAYNMQVAESCMDGDAANAAELLTDSTVSADWDLLIGSVPVIQRHQRSIRFKVNYKLNGPDRAARGLVSKKWEKANVVQRAVLRKRYRTQEWRDMDNARRRAKRALSRGEKHGP